MADDLTPLGRIPGGLNETPCTVCANEQTGIAADGGAVVAGRGKVLVPSNGHGLVVGKDGVRHAVEDEPIIDDCPACYGWAAESSIYYDPESVGITINGSPLSGFLTGNERVTTIAGKVFNMSTDGTSSTGEMVSVIMVEPGDRVRLRPHGDARTVTHVAWTLGLVAIATAKTWNYLADDAAYAVHEFHPTGSAWPTVERVIEERG